MQLLGDSERRYVGPYRLVAALGRGAMGEVYLARSRGGRSVAVKVVSDELSRDAEFRRALAREVQGALQVNGFYTAQVIEADADPEQEGQSPWIATSYVPGPSLQTAVEAHGPLPVAAARVLGAGLAEGLSAVHAAGLSHGDLKPGNVILGEDGPRVTDFAVSRALDAAHPSLTVGEAFGWYIAPERVRGEDAAGTASDVFSLGGVLVYAVTGHPPFGGEAGSEVLHRIVHEEPDLSSVPQELRGVVQDCLAKDAAVRPSLTEVLRRFAAPQHGSDGTVPPWLPPAVAAMAGELPDEPQNGPDGPKRIGRRGILTAVGAVVAAAVAIPLGLTLGNGDGDDDSKDGNAGSGPDWQGGGDALPASVTLVPRKAVSLGKVDDSASFSFSPDSKSLAVGGVEQLRLFSAASGDETGTRKVKEAMGELHGVAYSPHGGMLAVGYHWNTYAGISSGGGFDPDVGGVTVWDAASNQPVAKLKSATGGAGLMPLWSVALSPDGQTVAAACSDEGNIGKVPVWDVRSGKLIKDLVVSTDRDTSTSWMMSVAFSPDGKTLAAGYSRSVEGGLVFWEASSGQYRRLATEQVKSKKTYGVSGLAFSPDSKSLVCAYGGVEVWDATSHKHLATLAESSEGFSDVAFSPDGKLIAAESHGSVTVWDAASHKEVVSAEVGNKGTGNIAFSPDGKILAASVKDARQRTVIQLWDVR
ncbi:serine/threonine-protein kinase [Streptomyces sp. NPDC006990]|uniref:WD40 repeat domain-containing serine/threonine protein kinase n=1 Tax=unclassified Streptomyces TaxID=2593676 RepID=UPI0034515F99